MERILSDWLHNLPVTWMAVLFFGCGYLTVALIYAVVVEYPNSFLVRARAFAAGMLSPLGTLFALFVVFTAAQVWNDNDREIAAVAQVAQRTSESDDSPKVTLDALQSIRQIMLTAGSDGVGEANRAAVVQMLR